jgi:hypothetical protein
MEGFSVWVNPYQDTYAYRESGSGDAISAAGTVTTATDYGLQQQNGILEFPFYENAEMSAARRNHRLNGTASEFYYIWSNGANVEKIDPSDKAAYNREATSYRFLGEPYTAPLTYPVPAEISASGGEILIGNPYMSTINFVRFLEDNPDVIYPNYRLWDGSQFFVANVDGSSVVTANETAGENPGYISPLQSFFVTVKPAALRSGHNFLTFDVEKNVVQPAPASTPRLRSGTASAEENIIRIHAQNNGFTSETLIGKRANARDGYHASEDVYKLFSQKLNVPEIYTVADKYALVMNFIQGESELTIPLGLKTNAVGQTKLTLTGMANYEAGKIEFVDMAANRTIDITDKDSYEYSFNNQTQGVKEGQFYLRIQHSPTGINTPEPADLHIYRNQEEISILSVSADKIRQIAVYDLTGRKLYGNGSVNSDRYSVKDRWPDEKVLVVKVITEQKVQSVKLMKQKTDL